jgi:hypothetical protein
LTNAAAVFLNPSSVGLVMNLQIPRTDGKQGPAAMTKKKQAHFDQIEAESKKILEGRASKNVKTFLYI